MDLLLMSQISSNRPQILNGRPVLAAQATGKRGAVYYDYVVIKEYDENKVFLKDIYLTKFNKAAKWRSLSMDGNKDHRALKISGTTDDTYCFNNLIALRLHPAIIMKYALDEGKKP